jgi:hypothetical protein
VKDVFIHHSALLCRGPLVAGDKVQFTIEPSPKGDRGVDVELLAGVGERRHPKAHRDYLRDAQYTETPRHGGRRP